MGVIPSGTSEPWFWAAREAAANDALARLFHQLADREDERDFRAGENELNRADTNRRFEAGQQLQRENMDRADRRAQEQRDWTDRRTQEERDWRTGERALDREERMNRPNLRYGRTSAQLDVNPDVVSPQVEAAWRESEKRHGLPLGTLNAIYGAENSGGHNVGKNPRSSANGHFQFTDGTLKSMGIDPADRSDPVKMGEHAARLAAKNRDAVKGKVEFAGNASDIPKYYILHQQGSGGGAEILSNPKGKIMDNPSMVANPQRGALNGAKYGMTNEQFTRMYANKVLPYYSNWHQRTEGGTKVVDFGGARPAVEEGVREPGYAGINPTPLIPDKRMPGADVPQAGRDYLKAQPGANVPPDARRYGFPSDNPYNNLPQPSPSLYPVGGGSAGAALPPQQPGARMSPPAEQPPAPQQMPGPQQAPPTPPGVAAPPPIVRSPTGLPPQIQAAPFPGPSGSIPGGMQTVPNAAGFPTTLTAKPVQPDLSFVPGAPMQAPIEAPPAPPAANNDPFGLRPGWAYDYLPSWAGGVTPPSAGMPLPGSIAPIAPRSVKTESVGAPVTPAQRPTVAPPSGGGSVAPSTGGLTKTQRYMRGPDGKPMLVP